MSSEIRHTLLYEQLQEVASYYACAISMCVYKEQELWSYNDLCLYLLIMSTLD